MSSVKGVLNYSAALLKSNSPAAAVAAPPTNEKSRDHVKSSKSTVSTQANANAAPIASAPAVQPQPQPQTQQPIASSSSSSSPIVSSVPSVSSTVVNSATVPVSPPTDSHDSEVSRSSHTHSHSNAAPAPSNSVSPPISSSSNSNSGSSLAGAWSKPLALVGGSKPAGGKKSAETKEHTTAVTEAASAPALVESLTISDPPASSSSDSHLPDSDSANSNSLKNSPSEVPSAISPSSEVSGVKKKSKKKKKPAAANPVNPTAANAIPAERQSPVGIPVEPVIIPPAAVGSVPPVVVNYPFHPIYSPGPPTHYPLHPTQPLQHAAGLPPMPFAPLLPGEIPRIPLPQHLQYFNGGYNNNQQRRNANNGNGNNYRMNNNGHNQNHNQGQNQNQNNPPQNQSQPHNQNPNPSQNLNSNPGQNQNPPQHQHSNHNNNRPNRGYRGPPTNQRYPMPPMNYYQNPNIPQNPNYPPIPQQFIPHQYSLHSPHLVDSNNFIPPNAQFHPAEYEFHPNPSQSPNQLNLRQQIEYYFSVENLVKDQYLRSLMNQRGYVEIDKLLSFNRIRRLIHSPDRAAIEFTRAARNSNLLKVKRGAIRIRRDWKRWINESTENNTANGSEESSEEEVDESELAAESSEKQNAFVPQPQMQFPYYFIPPGAQFYPPMFFQPQYQMHSNHGSNNGNGGHHNNGHQNHQIHENGNKKYTNNGNGQRRTGKTNPNQSNHSNNNNGNQNKRGNGTNSNSNSATPVQANRTIDNSTDKNATQLEATKADNQAQTQPQPQPQLLDSPTPAASISPQ